MLNCPALFDGQVVPLRLTTTEYFPLGDPMRLAMVSSLRFCHTSGGVFVLVGIIFTLFDGVTVISMLPFDTGDPLSEIFNCMLQLLLELFSGAV